MASSIFLPFACRNKAEISFDVNFKKKETVTGLSSSLVFPPGDPTWVYQAGLSLHASPRLPA